MENNNRKSLRDRREKGEKMKSFRGEYSESVQNDDRLIKVSNHKEGKSVSLLIEPAHINSLLNQTIGGKDSIMKVSIDSFISAVDRVIEAEQDDWGSLFVKDLLLLIQEEIFSNALRDYAKDELGIKIDEQKATSISYVDRFNKEGELVGKAIRFSITTP